MESRFFRNGCGCWIFFWGLGQGGLAESAFCAILRPSISPLKQMFASAFLRMSARRWGGESYLAPCRRTRCLYLVRDFGDTITR